MAHEIKISKEHIAKILGSNKPTPGMHDEAKGVKHPGELSADAIPGEDGIRHPGELFSADASGSPLTVRKITARHDEKGGIILDLE